MNIRLVIIQTLTQLSQLLERLDEEIYTEKLELFSSSTIGNHTRHILEFFQCLLVQCENGKVNYDLRERNKKLESEPAFAVNAISCICNQLAEVKMDQSLILETNYQTDSRELIYANSTVEREMIYNIEHAIHHMAMIKMGLKLYVPDMEIPDHFGLAPSTIRYQKSRLSNAKMEIVK